MTTQRSSLAVRLLGLCAAIAGVRALTALPADSPAVMQLYFGAGSLSPLPLAGLLACCLPLLLGATRGRLRIACGATGLCVAALVAATQPLAASLIGAAGLAAVAAITVLEPLRGHQPRLRFALRLLAALVLILGAVEMLRAVAGAASPPSFGQSAGIGGAAAALFVLLGLALVLELGPPRPGSDAGDSGDRILATACGTLIVAVALARLSAMSFTHHTVERFNREFIAHAHSELASSIASIVAAADAQALALLASRDGNLPSGAVGRRHGEFAVPLGGAAGRELVFAQGYFLRTRLAAPAAAGGAGELQIELPQLQERLDALRQSLSGMQVQLCATRAQAPRCFPMSNGAGAGPTVAYDAGELALFAHGPVAGLGLELRVARGWRDILLPLRQQMLFGLLLLTLASGTAILLLRARVLPLVRGLVAARVAAEASEARFLAASENSPDGFAVMEAVRDVSGNIVDFRVNYLNGSATRLWCTQSQRVVGQLISRLLPEVVELGIMEKYRTVVETGNTVCEESPVITPGVAAEWVEHTIVRLNDGITVTFRDISHRKQAESRLKQLAQSDVLTGLPNRAMFYDRLDHAMIRARRTRRTMALLFMDIDHFKRINDSHGHAGGDALLKKFAERLRREVRKSDTVARLAGDEFTVILEELHDRADAEKVAGGILKAVNQPLRMGDKDIQITSSIGIALYDGEGLGSNELLDRADLALYAVKRTGRNACVIYSPAIDMRGPPAAATDLTCMSGSWKQD